MLSFSFSEASNQVLLRTRRRPMRREAAVAWLVQIEPEALVWKLILVAWSWWWSAEPGLKPSSDPVRAADRDPEAWFCFSFWILATFLTFHPDYFDLHLGSLRTSCPGSDPSITFGLQFVLNSKISSKVTKFRFLKPSNFKYILDSLHL